MAKKAEVKKEEVVEKVEVIEEVVGAGKDVEVVEEAPKQAEKAVTPKEYAVYGPDKKYIRTYSTEIHGKDAKALAEQFAKKINGTIK